MKYYEILPTHTETPRNTTREIANICIEFNYHFLTLQKKNPITFEQECTIVHPMSLAPVNRVIIFFNILFKPMQKVINKSHFDSTKENPCLTSMVR